MLEFVRVDHAPSKPFTCVCGSHTGPFVRTFFERWGEEIYLCESCVSRAAKCNGLVKGARQMELIRASRLVDGARAELAAMVEQRDEVERARAALAGELAALEAELENERGKVAQLEHILGSIRQTADDPTVPAAA